jgi:myo-inositol-1(or 4)-monophosphatase
MAAAHAAGQLVRERSSATGDVRSKSSATDFVSQTDIDAGVVAVRAIAEDRPNASFVVEEDEVYDLAGVRRGHLSDPEVWVIDPIDGTTSFLHGFPCFSVSVALLRDGQPVAGAVYNAALDEMNSAAAGRGAFRDGNRLAVASAKAVSDALLVTGFPYDRTAPLDRQLAVLGAFLRAPVHGIRRDGSAAIDCCHVAAGRCDGFWEFGLQPWDTAAGVVICREAGATITDAAGVPWSVDSESICVANPALHAAMLRVIAEASALAG